MAKTNLLQITTDDEILFEHIKLARTNPKIEEQLFTLFFYGKNHSKKVFNWLRKKAGSKLRELELEDLYQDLCFEFVNIVRYKYNHEHASINFRTFCYTKFTHMLFDALRSKNRHSCLKFETDIGEAMAAGQNKNGEAGREAATIEHFFYTSCLDLGQFSDVVHPTHKFELRYDMMRFIQTLDDSMERKIASTFASGLYKQSDVREATLLEKGQYEYTLRKLHKKAAAFFGR